MHEAYTSSCSQKSNQTHNVRSTPALAAVGRETTRDAAKETPKNETKNRPNHEG